MNNSDIAVREFREEDLPQTLEIWNEVVEEGVAFPQENLLGLEDGIEFFTAQTFTGVAEDKEGNILGMYILHPNNVGRCGHIGNASYAVRSGLRGNHIGDRLVGHSLKTAKEKGFSLIQFNAVVDENVHAQHLYERHGFNYLGTIPKGFRLKSGKFADILLYYIEL